MLFINDQNVTNYFGILSVYYFTTYYQFFKQYLHVLFKTFNVAVLLNKKCLNYYTSFSYQNITFRLVRTMYLYVKRKFFFVIFYSMHIQLA